MNTPNTTKLTQSQAARAAGVSHTSIWRAIKRGRLSAERDDDGAVLIDASELVRVFPKADLSRAGERSPDRALLNREHNHEQAPELHVLRMLVEELQADKRRLLSDLDRAAEERSRLLAMFQEQTEQVRLLTDQRERKRSWWARWW